MPMHDWSRVNAGLFHHFHQGWCWEIGGALNRGPLPDGYTALVEQRSGSRETDVLAIEEKAIDDATAGGVALRVRPQTKHVRQSERDYYADKASRIAIRHRLGRVVAFIEIVSPGNKHDDVSLRNFCEKVVEAIRSRIHVLVIDPFPPTRRDPAGIHKAIWDHFEEDDPFNLTGDQNRVLASYEADGINTAFIETIAVGEALPAMPLFIAPGVHVPVPLEESYSRAWNATPKSVRRLVE